jgi:hypothetical protein
MSMSFTSKPLLVVLAGRGGAPPARLPDYNPKGLLMQSQGLTQRRQDTKI